jgi:hypothetical protein
VASGNAFKTMGISETEENDKKAEKINRCIKHLKKETSTRTNDELV